jgi:hypothetical protein
MSETLIATNHTMHCAESFTASRMTYTDEHGIPHRFNTGDVVRPLDPNFTFGDSVIAGFDAEGNARLLRPYLYISIGGTGLVGYETIDRLRPATLVLHWKKIDIGRTTSSISLINRLTATGGKETWLRMQTKAR